MSNESEPKPQPITNRQEAKRLRGEKKTFSQRSVALILTGLVAGGVAGSETVGNGIQHLLDRGEKQSLQEFKVSDVISCENPTVRIGGLVERDSDQGLVHSVVVSMDITPGPKAGDKPHMPQDETPEGVRWQTPSFQSSDRFKDDINSLNENVLLDGNAFIGNSEGKTVLNEDLDKVFKHTVDPAMQKTVDVTIPINPEVKGTRLVTLWPEVERASINGVPSNEGTRFDIIGNQCASFMVHVDDLGEISLVEK